MSWYNEEILAAKRTRRKAERKWRSTKSALDLSHYESTRNLDTNLTNKVRSDFYKNLIEKSSSDQEKRFKATKQLLKQSTEVPLPPHVNKSVLANEMGNFFVEKTAKIRKNFNDCIKIPGGELAEPNGNQLGLQLFLRALLNNPLE